VRAADDLGAFVDRAVRGHVVRAPAADAAALAAKVDAAMAAMLRALLHHPSFQALESTWRAVDFFVRRLDTNGDLQVHLVDGTSADVHAVAGGTHPALADRLFARAHGVPPWSLVVVLHPFGAGDVESLTRLAALGEQAGVPMIVGSTPALAGGRPVDSDDGSADASAAWNALRHSPAASYLSVAWPRLLLRLPYGRENETDTGFAFEEFDGPASSHEAFLWGSGAVAVGLVIAQSVAEGDEPATHGTIDRLPLFVEQVDGEALAVPCAERVLSDSALGELLSLGFTPLVSMRDGDVVRLPRIQSVATPAARLAVAGRKRA
jgi:predicted component of type VI protein secretion system